MSDVPIFLLAGPLNKILVFVWYPVIMITIIVECYCQWLASFTCHDNYTSAQQLLIDSAWSYQHHTNFLMFAWLEASVCSGCHETQPPCRCLLYCLFCHLQLGVCRSWPTPCEPFVKALIDDSHCGWFQSWILMGVKSDSFGHQFSQFTCCSAGCYLPCGCAKAVTSILVALLLCLIFY
jgi:hypothetical protein